MSIIVVALACLLASLLAVSRVGGRPRHALGARHRVAPRHASRRDPVLELPSAARGAIPSEI